jgi:predicted nucleotidyltransferase
MPKTISQITPDERSTYHLRAMVEQRKAAAAGEASVRWGEAGRVARQAAMVLKQQFTARRVVLFGSVTRVERFTPWSDIDLAVWGVPPERFYAAVAAVTSLSAEIGVDLVDSERCGATLLAAIERDGVEL